MCRGVEAGQGGYSWLLARSALLLVKKHWSLVSFAKTYFGLEYDTSLLVLKM